MSKYIGALKEIKEIFDENNLPFYLDWGTLLGFVKYKKMLAGDDDLDLGILEVYMNNESIKKKIARELGRKEFVVYFYHDIMNISKGGTSIDISFMGINKKRNEAVKIRFDTKNYVALLLLKLNRLVSASYYHKFKPGSFGMGRDRLKINLIKLLQHIPLGVKHGLYRLIYFFLSPFQKVDVYYLRVPAKCFTKLKDIEFYGLEVKIPSNAMVYLKKQYGEEEFTQEFDSSKPWFWWEHGEWKKTKGVGYVYIDNYKKLLNG